MSIRSLADAEPGAPPLTLAVERVHASDLHVEDRLDGLPDLRLAGVRGDDERVLVELVLESVAFLRDHRPEQDVPVVEDPAHRSSCPPAAPALATKDS